ncbi:LAMI_0G09494g1_1 [Lachancea mirantina]|uniref:LAMI_0G09494g1_1 n=1 Tax=Lachancea mirantina TaxID=1230905 RepID=A0A1G4KAA3_9SACH|nr:LAMI_0G09494g1_1 [Lachancea mirantina]
MTRLEDMGSSEPMALMSLKVLYTVDNEVNTYLARSKNLVRVRKERIPSPNNDDTQLTVGVIELSGILEVIRESSPELFSSQGNGGLDYNVYFRDLCETDEPFVSFGLLSTLKKSVMSEVIDPNGTPQAEDEWPAVVGRVCSNFSALLSFKSNNSMAGNSSASIKSASQTLEVKVKFSRVITATSSRRSSIEGRCKITTPTPRKKISETPAAEVNKRQEDGHRIMNEQKPGKRQTNPMPAPKAARTQSLPIWNQTKNAQFSLPANSIAHKIYLADRMSKESETSKQAFGEKRPIFHVNSLQQDNTVQKSKVDDSVSKRFEFITKKKVKSAKPVAKKPLSKPKATTVKKIRRDSAASNFSPLVPAANNAATGGIKEVNGTNLKLSNEELMEAGEEVLALQDFKADIINEVQQEEQLHMENKENEPPRDACITTRFEDLLGMESLGFKTPSDNDKFFGLSKEMDPLEWFGDIFGAPPPSKSNSPERDPQTCNTLPIDDEDQELNKSTTSDNDKTSPLDTLSMPLLELDQRKQRTSGTSILTCKDQLKRLPILCRKSALNGLEEQVDDDATSEVMTYSTSPKEQDSRIDLKRRRLSVPSSPLHEAGNGFNEMSEETMKKRKTMPSSPTSILHYEDEAAVSNEDFSFVDTCLNPNVDSTPATQYRSSDADAVKTTGDKNPEAQFL